MEKFLQELFWVESEGDLEQFEGLSESNLADFITSKLQTSDARRITVILQYYGINCEKKSLRDIGSAFGVSAERARQIRHAGMRRLRHGTAKAELVAFAKKARLEQKDYTFRELYAQVQELEREVARPSSLVPDIKEFPAAEQRVHEHVSNLSPELEAMRVVDLRLTTRAENCLRSEYVNTVGELMRRTKKSFRRTPNMGKKTFEEITAVLASHGVEWR